MRLLLGAVVMAAYMAVPAAAQMQGSEVVEIPLSVHEGRIAVTVTSLDGTEFDFLLSTGASMRSQTGSSRLAGKTQLKLGPVDVITADIPVVDDAILTVGGKIFDGVVGGRTLNQFDILLDVPGHRMLLKQPGRRVEWEGISLSDPIRLRIMHGIIISLDVELNGREYPAMFDVRLGSLGINETVQNEASVDGDRVETFKVAGTTYSDLPVRVLDQAAFGQWSPNGEGFVYVGASVALECVIAVSYLHRELRTCVR